MDQQHWQSRSSVAAMMGREPTEAETLLIRRELTGGYGARAWDAAHRSPRAKRS